MNTINSKPFDSFPKELILYNSKRFKMVLLCLDDHRMVRQKSWSSNPFLKTNIPIRVIQRRVEVCRSFVLLKKGKIMTNWWQMPHQFAFKGIDGTTTFKNLLKIHKFPPSRRSGFVVSPYPPSPTPTVQQKSYPCIWSVRNVRIEGSIKEIL